MLLIVWYFASVLNAVHMKCILWLKSSLLKAIPISENFRHLTEATLNAAFSIILTSILTPTGSLFSRQFSSKSSLSSVSQCQSRFFSRHFISTKILNKDSISWNAIIVSLITIEYIIVTKMKQWLPLFPRLVHYRY